MKVAVAIARNGRERRIAEFTHYSIDGEAHDLMARLQSRNIPACLHCPEQGEILAWTSTYYSVGHST